jgi:2-iminobutanoate/2-iminopropanoate deaminase
LPLDKKVIIPEGGAKPLAPYSPGIKVGEFVFTAGQVALDPETGKLIEGDVQAETRQALENLKKILLAAGSSLEQVVKTTVFLSDIKDYGAVNEVYGEYFTDEPPARSAVQVAALPAGAAVEIEAVAIVG